jgi:hypothetical protein
VPAYWYFSVPADDAGVSPPLGFDDHLKYLPDDCDMIRSMRLDKIVYSKRLVAMQLQRPTIMTPRQRTGGAAQVGLAPEEVIRLTEGSSPSETVLIATASRPVTLREVIPKTQGPCVERQVRDCALAENPQSGAGYCIAEDGRIVIVGKADTLRKILDRNGPPQLGPAVRSALDAANPSAYEFQACDFKRYESHYGLLDPYAIEPKPATVQALTSHVGWASPRKATHTAVLHCPDEPSAEAARATIEEQYRSAFRNLPENPALRQTMSREGSRVIIKREVTVEYLLQ